VIDVRLYAHLPAASKQGLAEFQVETRPGLTVSDVLNDAGIPPEAVYIIMIDGAPANLDSALSDNHRLALFPAVSGG
jgi:sulfur carrier protein ThiS